MRRELPVRKFVAYAIHRQEVTRFVRVRFDLAPDVFDMRIDLALIGFKRDAVHRVEQLRACEDAAGLARERCHQLKFSRRQFDVVIIHFQLHARHVECEIGGTDDVRAAVEVLDAAQHAANARDQLFRMKGLVM